MKDKTQDKKVFDFDDKEITITELLHIDELKDSKIWPYGEWMEEPDFVAFVYKGIRGLIIRDMDATGSFFGCVYVPRDCAWSGRKLSEIDCDCHGGLSYSEVVKGSTSKEISLVIGFDCAHLNDICPLLIKQLQMSERTRQLWGSAFLTDPTYKNMNFCVKECKKIIDQMLAEEVKKE